jgi:DNA-binding transcriptional ArsR family regulator
MSGYPLARSEGIVTEELGDEMVAYVEATQTVHALSKDAASVWRQCDGHSSAADIARRLGLDEARVAHALDELSGAELMEEPEGISRRALYKRTAKLGAAALGAPLIYSVAIRPTSAHASTPPCSCPAGQPNCGCPGSGSVKLSNGTCAKPCTTGDQCTMDCFVFSSLPVHGYCSTGNPSSTSCSTDADCPVGSFCNTFCIPATC